MMDCARAGIHDLNRASRKAEEAAWRRFQAAEWLESLVGPLGLQKNPSERDFISCLRNGLTLCNAINKIQPGAVPKVVEIQSHLQSLTWESSPLPAYQYFENVRNFLVAVEELKLPAFEASDLERDALEMGSAAKVVDCILALKAYHEWKQVTGGNGFFKYTSSPMVLQSTNRNHPRGSSSMDSCRRIDMSPICENRPSLASGTKNFEDSIVKLLADRMVDSKENFDSSLLASLHSENVDPVMLFGRIISCCLDEPEKKIVSESMLNDHPKERHSRNATTDPSTPNKFKSCRACFKLGNCGHKHLLMVQEKELTDLKVLFSKAKFEFRDMQIWMQEDMKKLENQLAEISSAALGYHRVLKENRNLHNMVQDLKGNIRVYCRIRPTFSPGEASVIEFSGEDGSLVINDPIKPNRNGKAFQFNRVFGPTATQDNVYEDIRPLIKSVMDGYNVCIFAYGQTGSGKTYTMSGPSVGSAKEMGINYLALNELFHISHKMRNMISYDIHVQMVEIYNEQVRDLLTEDSINNKLEIRSCAGNDGLSIPDATMHSVKSGSDVLDLMRLGDLNRVVSATAMNSRSSRSHSVVTVHVHGKDTSGGVLRSCLHLVDLAGSERVDKSEVTGDRLKEAQYINKSLSCLGDVIAALAQKNSHIPYRNSKLTLLLQGSLGGHAKTLMFAHVSPEANSFGETISTLKFAQRVSTVELGAARLNKESSEVMKLKEQIESLKKALANRESESEITAGTELSPSRPRRMSIENCIAQKSVDTRGQKTLLPNRARRMSLEGPSLAKTDDSQKKMRSDEVSKRDLTAGTELSPSHPRWTSIENCSAQKSVERRGMKTPLPYCARRMSLEGPRRAKLDDSQTKMAENMNRPPPLTVQRYNQAQDADTVSKSYGELSNNGLLRGSYQLNSHRSPTSSAVRKHLLRTDNKTSIPKIQLPMTPESSVTSKNQVHIAVQSAITLSTDFQTPSANISANGKGSQIRKSLRHLGKLINGSDKRNQKSMLEAQSTNKCTININEERSPLAANTRVLRRRSLIDIQASGTEGSRRSSLGGKTNNSNAHGARNAKTPPSTRPSAKTTKRWM